MLKVGIIGLGLIGGSIFKSLKALDYDVIAVSKSQDGENIFKTYDVLKDREIVFVCTAMNKTMQALDELENYLPETTIVTDVCSLKEFVCQKARPYKFIPSHPMAGTEHKGFESSFDGLFKGAKWVMINPSPDTSCHPLLGCSRVTALQHLPTQTLSASAHNPLPKVEVNYYNSLISVIKDLGAIPVFASAKEHDEAAAMISHMPMVVAQALMLAVKDNPLALEIASSGFRDMTRLALSNEEMADDMVTMNHKNIEQAILRLYKAMGDLTNGDYPKTIAEIKSIRSKMF